MLSAPERADLRLGRELLVREHGQGGGRSVLDEAAHVAADLGAREQHARGRVVAARLWAERAGHGGDDVARELRLERECMLPVGGVALWMARRGSCPR